MKKFLIIGAVTLAAAVLMGGCAKRHPLFTGEDCRPGDAFVQLAEIGAWNWCGDPKAVTHIGAHRRTYAGWVDAEGSIVVASYDHDTGEIETAIVREKLEQDDHDNPSLLVLPDGRLMTFYSPHGGVRARKSPVKGMFYRTTERPEDITSWGEEMEIPTNLPGSWGFTYPNVVSLENEGGSIYLFWRGGNGRPAYSISTDEGGTWSEARALVWSQGKRPYVKVVSDGESTIHVAFTKGHPRGEEENSVYYMFYRDGAVHKADGTKIVDTYDLPVRATRADTVYNAAAMGSRAWVWDIALDALGRPVIAYVTFPDETDHRYWYGRWDGTEWLNYEITAGGASYEVGLSEKRLQYYEDYYSGGLALDHENTSVVYLSRQIEGIFEIERWVTPDGGVTWLSEPVTCGSEVNNGRPMVPRGHTADGPDVIWMHGYYRHYYVDYDTAVRMRVPR